MKVRNEAGRADAEKGFLLLDACRRESTEDTSWDWQDPEWRMFLLEGGRRYERSRCTISKESYGTKNQSE